MALTVWTDDQVLQQLNSGTKWTGSTITYAFPTLATGIYGGGGEGTGFTAFSTAQQTAATLALTLWDDLITPDLQQVAPGTSYTSSNIEFGNSTTGVSYAHAYFPTTGSVWFNAAYGSTSGTNNLMSPTVGQHGFLTYMHEIGHAMGLEHMGDYNGATTSGPSCFQDSTVYSIMSYYGPSWGSGAGNGEGQVAWADWVGSDGRLYSPQTPMLNDIMAMQAMYGVEATTRTGDTVYGFNSNLTGAVQSIYDFTLNKNPILAIFNSAGIDTLDVSGWSTASTIDIARGGFSSANAMTFNIAIAYTCDIENAVGGAGADAISGNALANWLSGNGASDVLYGLAGDDRLNGGAGNDRLDGGIGLDTVVFSGTWDAISFAYNAADLSVTFSGLTFGTDIVFNVEYFTDANNVTKNLDQLLGTTPDPDPQPQPVSASIATATASLLEGNAGTASPQHYLFTVTLGGASGDAQTLDWALAAGTSADASDFIGATAGTISFAAGQTQATIDLLVNGDTASESDEAFSVLLSNASSGLTIVKASAAGTVLNDDAKVIVGTDAANILYGTMSGDTIFGRGGGDTLYGYDGSDLLDGEAGNDSMYGGNGDDTYFVDTSRDRVIENAGAGIDTVKTTLTSYTLSNNADNLVFANAAVVNVRGIGNGLANSILTGAGDDVLNGGSGADTLTGNAGRDIFEFTSSLGSGNIDVITDFDTSADTIRIENAVFRSFRRVTGTLSDGAFNTGAAASEADDRIIFNAATGALTYDQDGTGYRAAVQFATLDLAGFKGTLSNADFVIV